MFNNEKGQTLVISIFLMAVVLSAGVVISSKFFNSLHNFAKSDNSNKALYVAESLAERLLAKDEDTLLGYITNNNCLQNCYVSFDDGSEAYANVSILGNSAETYKFKSSMESISEINLSGYPSNSYLDLCWNEKSSISVLYLYQQSDEYKVDNYAYNSVDSPYPSDFDTASPNYSYSNCFRINTTNTPLLLRIKSLYENSTLNLIPNPSSVLPIQGVAITSNGRFLDSYKRLVVLKKNASVPLEFDYVIYQRSKDTSLSK